MNFLTDIEKAKLEFYKNHVEIIIRSLPAYTVAICHRCHATIRISDPCLRYTTLRREYTHHSYDYSSASCPNCNIWSGRYKKLSDFSVSIAPIDHTICKIVEHVLKEKTNFFGKKIIEDSIKEIKVIRVVQDYKVD